MTKIDDKSSMKCCKYCSCPRNYESLWINFILYVIVMKYEHPWVNLELILENVGMSVEDFANLIEKTPSDVKNILNGEESINLDRAMKICAVFWWNPKYRLEMQADYDEQEYKLSEKYQKIITIHNKIQGLNFATA